MATVPMTTPQKPNSKLVAKCRTELDAYIQAHGDAEDGISFASFVRDHSAFIIENTPGNKFKDFWSNLFGRALSASGQQARTEEVDWSIIETAISSSGPSASDTHATPSTSSGTKSSQLTKLQKELMENNYANLPRPKWELATGKVVEDEMLKFCRTCKTEHPAHSLLLDLSDGCWVTPSFFTIDEINIMKNHNLPELPELPVSLQEYLDRYKSVHDLEQLTDINMAQCFHPKKHPDLHWAQRAIGDVLDLYHYKYDISGKTESDLLRRLWIFIEKCFDESTFEIVSGEKASVSSSDRKNDARSISGTEELSRKAVGHKVDILIKHLDDEYGCAEAGLVGGTKSTKYIKESTLKVPKTLRDMFWKLSKASPESINDICIPGFVINGTTMEIKLIDVPEGNVSRITTLGPLQFPREPATFYKFFIPLLTMMWQMKALLKETLRIIQTDESIFVPTISTPTPQPRVTACIPSPTPRKRKLSDVEN